MAQMTRAIGVMEFGGAEKLQVIEVPIEHAGPGQVRVRVHAAAVNPTDTYIPAGARAARDTEPKFPFVPGMDVAGVLDEIGDGVQTDLQIGDAVNGGGRTGSCARRLPRKQRAACRFGRPRARGPQPRRVRDDSDEWLDCAPCTRPA